MTQPLPLSAIRALMADGQLREALEHGAHFATYCGMAEAANGLSALSAQYEEHRRQWNSGTVSFDDYARSHARLTQAAADWLSQLPETPSPQFGKRRRLLDENAFKSRLFWGIVLAKVAVLGWTFYLWKTGGFQNDEALTTFSALAPAFVAYISLMLADFLRRRREHYAARVYVPGLLPRLAWILLPLYAVVQMYLVVQKVTGDLTFSQMNVALAASEAVLGGYIGQMVQAFFKREA